MSAPPVLTERHGRVGVLRLNRPAALNTFDRAMYAAFDALFAELAADESVWAIVITAEGERAFCAGVDLKALDRDLGGGDSVAGYGPLALTLGPVTAKPVLAAVHGHCIGEGVALALAADLVVASRDARFSAPEARVGVNAVDIPVLLARRLDYARAFQFLCATQPLSAEDCHRLGMVQRLAAPGEAYAEALALAQGITEELAPLAVRAMKKTLLRASAQGETAARRVGDAWRGRILRSADFGEGRRAFAEKRAPRFVGR